MTEIVAVDIGGTHARFALAEVDGGQVRSLGPETVLKTAEHASLALAWEHYVAILGRPAPRLAGISVAAPVAQETLRFANNPWVFRPAEIGRQLGLDAWTLINDFAAIGHAVAQVGEDQFCHLCGPDRPLPDAGVVSIVGPGTGLGIGLLVRRPDGYQVVPTEGGHVDFAPIDAIDDAILADLRRRHRRVSAERVASGPGLAAIHHVLAGIEGRAVEPADDKTLWTLALEGSDSLAAAALDRFCLSLGSVAGDIALAQGALAVVIAGGVGLRLKDHLPRSGFGQRFTAKGRFETMMAGLPVKLITHPQPGLFGAAAAFAQEHP